LIFRVTNPPATDLVTVKCLLNNIISTPGARAAYMDIQNFYLNNTLPRLEDIRYMANTIPTDIWTQYRLDKFVDDRGHIYARVDKVIYGLTGGKVARDCLLP
jgi:hypothetical protein